MRVILVILEFRDAKDTDTDFFSCAYNTAKQFIPFNIQ